MLYEIYAAIKTQLNGVATNENTQWFNMQYDGVMHYANGCFIEFPDALQFDDISKSTKQAPLKIRVHVYSKVISTHDGVEDTSAQAHETFAEAVKTALDKFTPESEGSALSTLMHFRGWQHWHKWKGWMVTYVDFECRKRI